jgi:hypothetical protein
MTAGQDLHPGGIKRCVRCQQLLPLENFTPKAHLGSGHDSWCGSCRNAYLRERRAQRKAAGSMSA